MSRYIESALQDLVEIAGNGLSYTDGSIILLVGELRKLNESMDYLKRAAGNIDDTLSENMK